MDLPATSPCFRSALQFEHHELASFADRAPLHPIGSCRPAMTRHASARLSCSREGNTSAYLIIGQSIKALGSVAMRRYSHLSDDEREQIGLCRRSRPFKIGAPKRSAVNARPPARARPHRLPRRALTRCSTPTGSCHCADGDQARSNEHRALYLRCRPAAEGLSSDHGN